MKRFLSSFIFIAAAAVSFAQSSRVYTKHVQVTEKLQLKTRVITDFTLNFNNSDSLSDAKIPTAKAVADYVRLRAGGGGGGVNFYNSNGTLTGNRSVDLGSFNLNYGVGSTIYEHLFNNGRKWFGAGTPIDEGFAMKINGTGRVAGQWTVTGIGFLGGVSQSDFISTISGSPASFQVNQNGGNYGLLISRADNGAASPHLTFYKTRGSGTASTLGALSNGDNIGNINFFGVAANGTTQALSTIVAITGYPLGGVSIFRNGAIPPTTTIPSMYEISTTDMSGVRRRRFNIFPDGEIVLTNISFLNFNNGYKLQVDGNSSVHGDLLVGAALGSVINSSAAFEVNSSSKGLLLPRLTLLQRVSIPSPAIGLSLYQTDATEGEYLNTSTGYRRLKFADENNSFATTTATDADYTAPAVSTFTILPEITANRIITLPAATAAGNELIFWNKNTSANSWSFLVSFQNSVADAASNTITTLVNQTVYRLISDGTKWVKTN